MRRHRATRNRRAQGSWTSRLRPGWLRLALAAAVAITLAVAALAGSGQRAVAASSRSAAAAGRPLQLEGTDPVTGKRVSLASFRGKPIVLNVWASWCTGCAAEASALALFERAHPEAQVVGLDIQDSKGGAKSFYRRFGWRHPSIFDPGGALAARLRVQGLPTTFFLDRRHRIVAQIIGETDLAGFTAGLKRATR